MSTFWDTLLDENYLHFVKLCEVTKYDVGKALVISPEGEIGVLFTKDGKHFLINQKEFERLAEKMFTADLLDYLTEQ